MRHNKKRRIAVNAMVDLALRESAGPVALAAMAHRQRVSLSCLEHLFAGLRGAGLVQSTRGPGGGYTLARDMSTISVADIVDAVDADAPDPHGPAALVQAVDELAHQLDALMHTQMAAIALDELVSGLRDAGVVVEPRARHRSGTARPPARAHPVHVPNSVFDLGASMALSSARFSPR